MMKHISALESEITVFEREFEKSVNVAICYLDYSQRTNKPEFANYASKNFGYAIAIAYMAYMYGYIDWDEYDNIEETLSETVANIHNNCGEN